MHHRTLSKDTEHDAIVYLALYHSVSNRNLPQEGTLGHAFGHTSDMIVFVYQVFTHRKMLTALHQIGKPIDKT